MLYGLLKHAYMRQNNTPSLLLCLLCLAIWASGQISKDDGSSLTAAYAPATPHAMLPFIDDIFSEAIHHPTGRGSSAQPGPTSEVISSIIGGTGDAVGALLYPQKIIFTGEDTIVECSLTYAISSRDNYKDYSGKTVYTIQNFILNSNSIQI